MFYQEENGKVIVRCSTLILPPGTSKQSSVSLMQKKKKSTIQLSTHWCAYNVDNSIKPRLKAILRASIFLPEAVASPVPWILFISDFSITIHSLEWRSFQNVICSTLSILKKKFPLILLSFYVFTVCLLWAFLRKLSTLPHPVSLFVYLFLIGG